MEFKKNNKFEIISRLNLSKNFNMGKIIFPYEQVSILSKRK